MTYLKNNSGISLIETLVSVVILTIIVFVLVGAYHWGLLFSAKTRRTLLAYRLAFRQIDKAAQALIVNFNTDVSTGQQTDGKFTYEITTQQNSIMGDLSSTDPLEQRLDEKIITCKIDWLEGPKNTPCSIWASTNIYNVRPYQLKDN